MTQKQIFALVKPHLLPKQADSDSQVKEMFLTSKGKRSQNTSEAYERDLKQFFDFIGNKPVNQITVKDLQDYESLLSGKPRTKYRKMAVVKSFFTYAHKIGYLLFNVGAAIDLQAEPSNRVAKILTEEEMIYFINSARENLRNYVLFRVMYNAKLRVSEVVGLCWKDVTPRPEKKTGQLYILGKGSKERTVLLSPGTYEALMKLKGDSKDNEPVFKSRKGGETLTRVQVHRIVKDHARMIGLEKGISAHWFRHSGSSHALDRGCPLTLLRDDLGHENISTTSIYAHAKPGTGSAEYSAL